MQVFNSIAAYLGELTFGSVAFRLLFAMVCGGLIGIERGMKRRPAGFRTHMLVCMGAALTMLIAEYEYTMLKTCWQSMVSPGVNVDISRLGAQVINGIGFLGAGTVILTGRQEVKGLTTAAGLWASACMGLAIGAGFYFAAILGCGLILLTITLFARLERFINANSRNMNIYVEFTGLEYLGLIIDYLKRHSIKIYDIELHKPLHSGTRPGAIFSLYLPSKQPHTLVLTDIASFECVQAVEEL